MTIYENQFDPYDADGNQGASELASKKAQKRPRTGSGSKNEARSLASKPFACFERVPGDDHREREREKFATDALFPAGKFGLVWIQMRKWPVFALLAGHLFTSSSARSISSV